MKCFHVVSRTRCVRFLIVGTEFGWSWVSDCLLELNLVEMFFFFVALSCTCFMHVMSHYFSIFYNPLPSFDLLLTR
jgi:hypothetical protein